MSYNAYVDYFEPNHAESAVNFQQESCESEFCLYFQPQVELDKGSITAMEALFRYEHPTKGGLSPDTIIPLAESHGLIEGLGSWILDESCRQAAQWQRESGMSIPVAVNISPLQVMTGNLVEHVSLALTAHRLSPQMLELELTESMALPDTPEVMQTLHDLKTLGIPLVLDDFGTGCADIDYLDRLPFDKLKLDKSWLTRLGDEEGMRHTKDVLDAVHARGLRATAEGVEDSATIEKLRHLGCDEVQGFFLATPMRIQTLLGNLQNPMLISDLKTRALGDGGGTGQGTTEF